MDFLKVDIVGARKRLDLIVQPAEDRPVFEPRRRGVQTPESARSSAQGIITSRHPSEGAYSPHSGVTARFQEQRYILTCSESRPFTGKPGESRVARLSTRVETWKPKVKLDGTRPVDSAATITREPSIASGLSRGPVHRRACLMAGLL